MSWPIYNDTITCKCGEELDPLEICECKQKERQHDSAVLSTPRTPVKFYRDELQDKSKKDFIDGDTGDVEFNRVTIRNLDNNYKG